MEQNRTFRIGVPRYPIQDPLYRILARQRSCFTHYYFYILFLFFHKRLCGLSLAMLPPRRGDV
ncbi:MAG: hypothetical protein ACRD3N_16310 [Terracidiphilus sp.]